MLILNTLNFRFKIQCTLFGNYCDELNNFIAAGDVQNAVVIIQLAKVKNFQGLKLLNLLIFVLICTCLLINVYFFVSFNLLMK
jgi:hypothetical protein